MTSSRAGDRFRDHLDKLKMVKDLVEPKPGELAATYLEEFEN